VSAELPERRWRPWQVSAAAAVSVLLVIGLVVAGLPANPAGTSLLARTTGVPPFYTQFGASNPASPRTLVIRSAATGAIVASAPVPDAPDWLLPVITVAAAPGARTFYVAYNAEWALAASPPRTADGRSIVFLAEWCDPDLYYNLCSGTMSGPDGYRDTQVRSLPVTGPGASTGGSLSTGSTLLLTQSSRYPVIETALAGPEPSELYLLVLSGTPGVDGTWSQLKVDLVSAASRRLLGVEYHAATHQSDEGQVQGVMLASDPGDQHLLLNYYTRQGFATGWIGQGALHVLPGAQSYDEAPMTAW
jgi:hypothetical protein